MVSKYSNILPKIFGKWEYLKSIIENDVYKLQILSKGLLLDNPNLVKDQGMPLYELMSYINIKYRRYYESILEKDLAEQISYWFYTYLLYQRKTSRVKSSKIKDHLGVQKLQRVFKRDGELSEWYKEFFKEAENYYKDRTNMIKNSGIF